MTETETSVFAGFFGRDRDMLEALQRVGTVRNYPKGTTILHQEDDGADVHFLLKGRARAYLISAEGKEIWLDEFGPGGLFGEMTALGAAARTCSVAAVTPVESAVFTQAQFLELMERHGSMGIAISRLLVDRVQQTTQRLFSFSVDSTAGRVLMELWRLSRPGEDGLTETRVIAPPPVITQLAHRVGAARETVSRIVNSLERRGQLNRTSQRWTLLHPDMLMPMMP